MVMIGGIINISIDEVSFSWLLMMLKIMVGILFVCIEDYFV